MEKIVRYLTLREIHGADTEVSIVRSISLTSFHSPDLTDNPDSPPTHSRLRTRTYWDSFCGYCLHFSPCSLPLGLI